MILLIDSNKIILFLIILLILMLYINKKTFIHLISVINMYNWMTVTISSKSSKRGELYHCNHQNVRDEIIEQ